MKKYKLIKEYPNSVELGTVVSRAFDEYGVQFGKYPEFWEKVIDYEILSFSQDKWVDSLAKLLPNGEYGLTDRNFSWTLDSMLYEGVCVESGDVKIHSIKRLEDGEVFTVGDEVTDDNQECKILRLRLTNNGLYQFSCSEKNGWCTFDNYHVVDKRPLLTTEDGIEIFKGGSYWYIQDGSDPIHHHHPNQVRFTNMTGNDVLNVNDKGVRRFSTKEAAEDYQVMNTPCLSVNDLIQIQKEYSCFGHTIIYQAKQLAESKNKLN